LIATAKAAQLLAMLLTNLAAAPDESAPERAAWNVDDVAVMV
jgi:hypothetical protein